MACDFFNETAPEPNDRPTTSEAFWGITLEDGGSDLGDDQVV